MLKYQSKKPFTKKIIIINDLEDALYKSAELLCKLYPMSLVSFPDFSCISIHMYHRKFASGISKIGRYIFLEILFWRRFFANGIHCVRGSHKLTVRVTMSCNDVSSSSAFFYLVFSPFMETLFWTDNALFATSFVSQ